MYNWDGHIIRKEATLIEALRRLNDLSGKTMVLFAVDSDGKMTGTITDGDIRRSLIATPLWKKRCTALSAFLRKGALTLRR